MRKDTKAGDCVEYQGSITVFLTILFLLFFSLVGAALENARILSSEGYMRTASHSAAMTVFGFYNRELYKDYGLFAYGGCDGKGIDELAEEFTEILIDNIQSAPKRAWEGYGDLYRFSMADGAVTDVGLLTDCEIFTEQIEAYLKNAAVQDLTGEIKRKVSGESGSEQMKEPLAITKEYEEGKFAVPQKQGAAGEQPLAKGAALKQDTAKGNPLEFFKDMMRDGGLNLVCNVNTLSEGIIEPSGDSNMQSDKLSVQKGTDEMGAADYLGGLIEGGDEENVSDGSGNDRNIIEKGTDKIKYICYANKQFSNYTEDKNRTTKYGLEYLISGKRKETDNLSHVVNKILGIRLLLNFGCIVSDKTLQEKSSITATILAGFTGMPPVIRAVQYTILLILAFQEACVDVTALLEGRSVPVIKTSKDIKMKYEEICLASRSLFVSKAKAYPKGGKTKMTDISYQQYLWFFLLEQSEKKIRDRSFDLIQYDLREKYNQSFVLRTCICQSSYKVCYQMPFLFENLPFVDRKGLSDINLRELEVYYEYKSG